MENASKALIIAGAILLAILLISLGIMIFNQAQDTVNNSGMSKAEISTFNNQFLKYEGTQKGSVVKSLINEVIASNADDEHKSNNALVNIKLTPKGADEISMTASRTSEGTFSTNKVKTSSSYTVELGYTSGRVNLITIKEQ